MDINDIKKTLYRIKKTAFGLSIPEIRKFAKTIAKEDYKEFFEQNDMTDYWLRMLQAFTIGYVNDDINILLHYFEKFIPFVDDWAVNDALCQNFRLARKYPKETWQMLMKYKNSKKEFEVRIVEVMLLSHFLNNEYIDSVIEVLDKLYTDSYYSKMGAAWAVATIVGKYPKKGMEYLENCHLDKQTYNKALQKIRESFRVSKKIKEQTKKMKK